MPKLRSAALLLAISVMLTASAILTGGCTGPATTEAEDAIGAASVDNLPNAERPPAEGYVETVDTVIVSVGEIDASLIASGSIIAPRTTQLSAEVTGRLASVRVDAGSVLRKGEVAFVVEPEPYEIALEEARAGMELAEAEAAQEKQELERTRILAEQRVVATQQLDLRRTMVAVANARVSQALARLHRAERDLERTRVRAPYDSSVVERYLHEGANLSGPASVVLTLQSIVGFEAQLNIPEASAVSAKVGDLVRLTIQGHSEPIDSKVIAVNPRIDPESRTYTVRAPVPGATAKAGAFVRAEITPVGVRSGLVLPRSAILRRDGRSLVFRLLDGKAVATEVVVGANGLRRAEIVSGLESGEEVIVGNMIDRLADGAPVVRTGSPATAAAKPDTASTTP
jgi:RND family efflux transporter MFP subunit